MFFYLCSEINAKRARSRSPKSCTSFKARSHCSLRASVPCGLANLLRSCHLFASRSDNPPRLLPDLPGVFSSPNPSEIWGKLERLGSFLPTCGPQGSHQLLRLRGKHLGSLSRLIGPRKTLYVPIKPR